ncbi:syntenin-1-like [Gigantopelta aegis]|uniref:syntenin-1-like n=1 Tax=Gigantopelta aegis TaxID=1735272 RepID=UPI001B887ADF|nr:syntenin-1-like [Gigantopelta aegis]XP_041358786.1 syntenin-1-like [Gigantopelta aegis]
MSNIYPSLEDMKVGQLQKAQVQHEHQLQGPPAGSYPPQGQEQQPSHSLYPSLEDYMGLSLTQQFVDQNMPVVAAHPQSMQVSTRQTSLMQVAPVTGFNKGLIRAEIKHGVREVVLCKDQDNKIGVRMRHVNNGLFICLVQTNSPAALAGLRFGDQILQINGENVAGWNTDKAHKVLKAANPERITMALRERPFERTITLQKDSHGYVGFVYKDGRIKSIVKDSSAARNGMLTDHIITEINGQNCVGIKDKEMGELFDAGGRTITVTIIPCVLYDHIVKCMGGSIIKNMMDHSIPDV